MPTESKFWGSMFSTIVAHSTSVRMRRAKLLFPGEKDKVALAPMSGSFGDELIVVGSPDNENGNSKNRSIGGVVPSAGFCRLLVWYGKKKCRF